MSLLKKIFGTGKVKVGHPPKIKPLPHPGKEVATKTKQNSK